MVRIIEIVYWWDDVQTEVKKNLTQRRRFCCLVYFAAWIQLKGSLRLTVDWWKVRQRSNLLPFGTLLQALALKLSQWGSQRSLHRYWSDHSSYFRWPLCELFTRQRVRMPPEEWEQGRNQELCSLRWVVACLHWYPRTGSSLDRQGSLRRGCMLPSSSF